VFLYLFLVQSSIKIENKIMKIQRIILYSLIINLISILSGYYGWNYQCGIVLFVFFISGLLYRGTIAVTTYFLILVSPFFLLFTFLIIKDGLLHLIPTAISSIIGLLYGLYIQTKLKANHFMYRISIGFYILLIFTIVNILHPSYLNYIFDRDRITLQNKQNVLPNLKMVDIRNIDITSNAFKNKVIVLDFWSTTCSVCIKKFPEFDKIKKEFLNNDNISFYAVGIANHRQNIEAVIEKANKLPFNFDYLFLGRNKANSKFISTYVSKVPTIIVLDRSGHIVFIGSSTVYENPFRSINKIIKEQLNEL